MTTLVQRTEPIYHENHMVSDAMYESKLRPQLDKALKELGITEEELSLAKFVPEQHLLYYSGGDFMQHKYNSTRRLSMEELGLLNKLQISDIGVLDPFPLFTDDAILIMKAEILRKEVFSKHARFLHSSTSGLDCCIRGYNTTKTNDTAAPFTTNAWTHPKTTELILRMAGVELEVVFDYEIAHANISVADKDDDVELMKEARAKYEAGKSSGEDIPAVVGWHNDSYPFVCVLMLSDTLDMIGGETSLRMGASEDGVQRVATVPGPQMGHASILQGRLIEHIAPKPIGYAERITMVTSYRAKDPSKHDGTVLSTVKPEINSGSFSNTFYPQYVDYRLNLLSKRFDTLKSSMLDNNGDFNKEDTIQQLKQLTEYLQKTWSQMEMSEEDLKNYSRIKAFKPRE